VEKTNLYIDLHQNLQSYYNNYLESFIRNIDEVLEYIPDDQYEWYYDKEKYSSFVEYLTELGEHRETFLVNTTKRYVVPFLANCTLGGCGYREYGSPQFSFIHDDKYLQVTVNSSKYTDKHNFDRSVRKLKLGQTRVDQYVFCAKTNKFIESNADDHSARLISYSNTVDLGYDRY
jgi:hypothetical protein